MYELKHLGDTWVGEVLYGFTSYNDGQNPRGGLVMDSSGNLYGTTSGGNNADYDGTVFQLRDLGNGKWQESIVLAFSQASGFDPMATLLIDNRGNLYGTAYQGGSYGGGVAFELQPKANGRWADRILHNFGM